jgi:hypothetical protein
VFSSSSRSVCAKVKISAGVIIDIHILVPLILTCLKLSTCQFRHY